MSRLFSLLITIVSFVASEDPGKVIANIGQGIQKEIAAVKQPIDATIAAVGSSQCANLKKLFGLSYEQLRGEREPDLDQLTLVYRTRTSNHTYNISTAAESLRRARALQNKEKLVIYVHGFTDDPSKDGFANISASFLESDEGEHITLLALDASSLIRWLYIRAATYVTFIGQKLATVLVTMMKNGLHPSQMHMVGHSLGAHICGFAGKEFQNITGKKIGRVSGLDPAGPCFTNIDIEHRLKETDAEYVDVIHTDAGVFGNKDTLGHADYFPNDGEQQPGCFLQTCSHSRAVRLYGASVQNKFAFPAVRCDSWNNFTKGKCYDEISYMGYASRPGTRGVFCLQTGDSYPFGLGAAGTKYNNNVGFLRNAQGSLANLPLVG